MAEEAKKISLGIGNVAKITLALIIALVIIISAVYAVRFGVEKTWWPRIGVEATSTPIDTSGPIGKVIVWIMGGSSTTDNLITWEELLIRMSVLIIILVALADILSAFSSFSTPVSWIIAICLSIIASASGWIKAISELMGLTAGIGAVGIMLIIFGALAAAVTLNLGIGGVMRRWRMNRQIEIEAMKSEKGTAKVTSAIKGLKRIEKELGGEESA